VLKTTVTYLLLGHGCSFPA